MFDDLEQAKAGLEDEEAFEESLVSESIVTLEPVEAGESGPPAPAAAPSLGRQPAWVGKLFGRFKLLRFLGSGAMGLVVQALDVNLQRIVALKILRRRIKGADEQKRVNQFLREARAAAQIEHPNVVRIHEINQHDGWWYIAMEMLEGQSLRRVVKATGRLAPARACPPIADAGTALAVAHELGIIHRDVKPSNLLLARNGRCKLTDFGLVRLDDPSDPFGFPNKIVGTPQFIAPEVILRREQTPALDVYSLGGTLYYALVGAPPYTGKTVNEILDQHINAPPPDLRQRLPESPASLAALIRQAMAKDPADRPSVADFVAALRAEAISWRPDDSHSLTATGPSIEGVPVEKAEGSTIQLASTTAARTTPAARRGWMARRLRSPAFWALAGAASIVILTALALTVFPGRTGRPDGRTDRDVRGLAQRFTGAPETYGVLPPGTIPKPVGASTRPPQFSWAGNVDTTGLRFVASKQGRHFYPIDAPAAVLISLENFVGYKTAADARADGKVPAAPGPAGPAP